jgi:hypothetical protein
MNRWLKKDGNTVPVIPKDTHCRANLRAPSPYQRCSEKPQVTGEDRSLHTWLCFYTSYIASAPRWV